MMNLFKSLLPLCILLLGGYHQEDGRIFHETIESFSVRNSKHFIVEKGQHSVVNPALSTTKGENRQNYITDIEEKENEVCSFKKNVSLNNTIKAAFYMQMPDYLSQYTQLLLFFFKNFLYYPFCKSLYIKFEVMRI